ncbi:oligosaccharide flippase family protein [Nocardioides flavescens]|uniref:Oligosaccharide flippase family protein n=1 Tax=Nocardioides flavescens TaxID=2691959 RepID=A0A6L7EX08_9ACTN|nr:oligosaccharide flippase family protein [Nocardioides flavescens]
MTGSGRTAGGAPEVAVDALIELEPEVENPALRGQLSQGTLSTQVRRGVAWNAGTRVFEQVLQLAATAILARVLGPEAYGQAALVAIVAGFAAIFIDMGIPGAVIQAPRLDNRLLSTAFWMNLATGIVMALIVCAVAVPVARFYGEPELSGLIMLSSLTFVLSLNAVHVALMQRALQFKRIGKMTFVTATAGVLTTLGAALLGLGAVSLVLGPIASRLVSVIQVQNAVRWWPTAKPSRAAARSLWAFGGGLTGFNIVNYAAGSADRFVLGRFVDVTAVGYYGRAVNLMMLPVQQTAGALSRVFFPAFASMVQDPPRLRRAWLRLVHAAWLLGLPLGVGLAVSAPAAVQVLYGDQWSAVVPLLVVLSGTIPFLLVSANASPLYQAMGETALQFRLSMVAAVAAISLILVGAQWGALGVAAAVLTRAPVSLAINLPPLMRRLEVRWRDLVLPLWRIALAAALMGAAAYGVGLLLSDQPAAVTLAGQVATGGVVYLGLIWPLEQRAIRELIGSRKRRGGRARSTEEAREADPA